MSGDDEHELLDLGPLDFFERYRQLPALVPIGISVLVRVPLRHEVLPTFLYCGQHVHVSLPPEMPYGQVLAVLTQAYVFARALTVVGSSRLGIQQLAVAASEIAEALGFDPASAEALLTSVGEWHGVIRI